MGRLGRAKDFFGMRMRGLEPPRALRRDRRPVSLGPERGGMGPSSDRVDSYSPVRKCLSGLWHFWALALEP
jgi:hypothetical protein